MTARKANFLFLLATIGWGASYLFTKYAVAETLPFALSSIRTTLAFIFTFILFRKKLVHVSKQTLRASALLGFILCATFYVFATAMQTANPASAGFFMATTVIFVPMIMMVFSKKLPSRAVSIGTIVTLFGLALFALKDSIAIEPGMLICLIGAFLYALHISVNNVCAKTNDTLQLGVYQLGFAAVFSVIGMLLFEPITYPTTSAGWTSVILLAVICTAFAIVVQSLAQGATTAETTGFIYSLEPIFASLFAYIFLGEVLQGQEWLGALFIFIGVLIANYSPKANDKYVETSETSV